MALDLSTPRIRNERGNYGKISPPGGMTERPKVPVLKTGWVQAHVGSNPTPSAMSIRAKIEYGEVPEWLIGLAC